MSAVNTGIPALFASWIVVPTDRELHGQRTIALTFLTMKSFTWSFWRAGVDFPRRYDHLVAVFLRFCLHGVAHDLEEGICQRQQRDANSSPLA